MSVTSKPSLPSRLDLPTVCEESRCPNMAECRREKIVTILTMGKICTRRCRYCAVATGKPLPLDSMEKYKIEAILRKLQVRYCVLTSVDRDDLPDGGAHHISQIVEYIHRQLPMLKIEFLLPDFKGKEKSWETIMSMPLYVFSHDLETVPSLHRRFRPQGSYRWSFEMLRYMVSQRRPDALVKTGMMVGLGEDPSELRETLYSLGELGVDAVTIGRYLRPKDSAEYAESVWVDNDQFAQYAEWARSAGIRYVDAGPWSRSSYLAHKLVGCDLSGPEGHGRGKNPVLSYPVSGRRDSNPL